MNFTPLPWHQSLYTAWWTRQHSDRPAHASLVVAPEDTGGEQLVQAMAAGLLCDAPTPEYQACGQCAACGLLQAYSHPDYRLLRPSILDTAHPIEELRPEKPSKEITIDDIRALDNMVNQTSHRGGKRVVVLYPAHKLNRNAANALLKTLEEPPPNTVFVLLAHDVQQLLPTIVSRCQVVVAAKPDTASALAYVQGIAPNRHSEAQWQAYLQQEDNAVMRVAQLAQTDYFTRQQQWIDGLAQGAKLDVVSLATTFDKHLSDANKARLTGENDGARVLDMAVLMTWLQRWLYDLTLLAQNGGVPRYYPQQAQALRQHAAHLNALKAHEYLNHLAREKRIADHPLNSRSWLEQLLLRYVQIW